MTENIKTITPNYHPTDLGLSWVKRRWQHHPNILDQQKVWSRGCSLVWSRTSACHADDPGSNLGNRTKPLTHDEEREPTFMRDFLKE